MGYGQRILNGNVQSPDWCGSVGWVSSCRAKGRQFNSRSGHVPELWARSLVGGAGEATDPCFSGTLMFFFLSSPLSKNKVFLRKKKCTDREVQSY